MTNKELDKWLAENVMGWTYREYRGVWCRDEHGRFFEEAGVNWAPTESISDAFQVAEKMLSKGYVFSLDIDRKIWTAEFVDRKDIYYVDANTAPLAISLAAKKAMEATK